MYFIINFHDKETKVSQIWMIRGSIDYSTSKGEQHYVINEDRDMRSKQPRQSPAHSQRGAGSAIASSEGMHLVETLWWGHAGLDDQAAHVLPALLEQRHEVVDGQHDVANQLILGHVHVSNSDTHAQHLLQLELDGRADFGDLSGKVIGVGDGGWELAGCAIVSVFSVPDRRSM